MFHLFSISLFFLIFIIVIILTKNPITLGVIILTIALFRSLITAIRISSWFAFALFIIYIGGLIVIFSYFIALTPNQRLSITLPIITALTLCFLSSAFEIRASTNLNRLQKLSTWINPPTFLIQGPSSITLFFLVTILFIALIVVVKITKTSSGPLRPF